MYINIHQQVDLETYLFKNTSGLSKRLISDAKNKNKNKYNGVWI